MRNRYVARFVFFFVFFVLYSTVRGAMGNSSAALFVAPAVAGVATVAISYAVKGYLERQ